jgi:hypothetical protein
VKALAAAAVLGACAAPASYLGAETPAACHSADAEHCASALAERDLIAGDLDIYDDAGLRLYVQSVADRLARGSHLVHSPRLVISNHDNTYAPFGNAIVIGRVTIEKLGSEAELAAVVAHEMAHIEGHHASVSLFGPETDKNWLAARRDAEGIADERAVALLEHSGYSPQAMPRALMAELDGDDDEHPPRADRIGRVATLAGGRIGFEGREELLHHLDRMVVGRDTRLGIQVGRAWVVANLGIALDLPPDDISRVEGDGLVLRHERAELDAYAIGAPWARELASHLEDAETADTALGRVTIGISPEREESGADPLARLEEVVRSTLPQPAPGMSVVIVERCLGQADGSSSCAGLVIELATHGDTAVDKRWIAGLRAATRRELAAAEPPRIELATATREAKFATLAEACPNPAAALELDDPDRVILPGTPFKCTDR